MPITTNQLTNANVFLEAKGLLGCAEEVKCPGLKHLMTEKKALGMVGKTKLPSGLDVMEAEFKWNGFYRDVFAAAANPYKACAIQVRSSNETWSGQGREKEVALVVHMRGRFEEIALGAFKPHDNAEYPSKFICDYVKVVEDGTEILEVDVLANVHKVNGEDMLATYRQNIGQQ